MTLQAKLTVGSVLLATLMVSFLSAMDLSNVMQLEFQGAFDRADLVKGMAVDAVIDTLGRNREVNWQVALRDTALTQKLIKLLIASRGILSIDVVAAENNQVIASPLENRLGSIANPPYPEFGPLVKQGSWEEKVKVLFSDEPHSYMLQEPLGSASGVRILYVRVILSPALLKPPVMESLLGHAKVAGISVVGAALLTFLLSMVAFRKLGRIGEMLDLATRGEYQAEVLPPAKTATDELSVMASKVSLLGQRLRGAQYEVSDLRGNIDHLLQDLQDGVFVFNRELRLVFASGSVEKFLGRDRSELPGQPLSEVFSPSTILGLLIEQSWEAGRSLRNRRVPVTVGAEGAAGTAAVVLVSVDLLESVPGGPAGGSRILVRLQRPRSAAQDQSRNFSPLTGWRRSAGFRAGSRTR